MKAKKKFGQNFLIDNNIINKISSSINASENDLIIEIGPGRGALTKYLKNKKCPVICYEIDTDMKEYLNKLEDSNLKVYYKDILESNIKEDIKDIKYDRLYVVGNLPYYITTAILKNLIEQNLDIEEMIFMVQEEVADRFSSHEGCKDYGSITLYLKYYFNITKLFKVGRNCFNPVPNVESAIILMQKRNDKPEIDKDKYFELLNNAFRLKRKTLKNNIDSQDFEKIIDLLKENGYDEKVRSEELPENMFIEITKLI